MSKRRYTFSPGRAYVFLLIYLLLMISAGFYFMEYATLTGNMLIILLLCLGMLAGRQVFMRNSLLLFCAMVFNVIITQTFTGVNFVQLILIVLMLVEALLLTNQIRFESFCGGYISCLTVIAVVSLVGNVMLIVQPALLDNVPKLINSRGRYSYFLLFSAVSNFRSSGSFRNQGIFWEPGAYQVFLCLAYIFELYRMDGKPARNRILILFLVSMVSTMSTTGIIVAVVLVIVTLGRRKGTVSALRCVGVLIVVGIAVALMIPQIDGFWRYTLITKIDQLLNYRPGTVNDASSRMDSVFYVGQAFLRSPLWGLGSSGYEDLAERAGHSMFTCTAMNWFGYYGIFWGATSLLTLKKAFYRLTQESFSAWILLGIFCISTFSEEVSRNAIVLILMFYGIGSDYHLPIYKKSYFHFLTGEKHENTMDCKQSPAAGRQKPRRTGRSRHLLGGGDECAIEEV